MVLQNHNKSSHSCY